MIDFACKRFSMEEVVRCGLGLSKADMKILSFLIDNKGEPFTSAQMAERLQLDSSTVQRSVKRLYEKGVLLRSQSNLKGGGYIFSYRAKSRQEIRDIIMGLVNNWTKRVESEFENWR